jgi:hypothetical protein
MSATTCPECGAAIPDGATCRDNFHALLLLESDIPGGPGSLAHFYAVASYGLQRATVADIRRRMRQQTEGARRVTRRPGDPEPAWHRGPWPMSVAEVLTVEAEQGAYGTMVERWARSVRETLDAARG